MNRAHVPGMAVAIVKDGQLKWSKGYGLAEISTNRAVTTTTPFMLASVSKTIAGTALMQVQESGAFQLDDTIESSLGIPFRHPAYPAVPPTYRQLLSHTAGIRDNWNIMERYIVDGDSPIPLVPYVAEYLRPGGRIFDASRNFSNHAPGAGYEYTNLGYAAVGALVQANTGIDFADWCDANIFQPLGMTNTSWFLSGLNVSEIAVPYNWRIFGGGWGRVEHYGYPDYPNGQLRSSVDDLSTFLMAHIEDGIANGTRILNAATVQEMRTIQFPSIDNLQGLAFYTWTVSGDVRIGHSGGDTGVITEMWYRESDGAGVIVLANSAAEMPWEFNAIRDVVNTLFDYSETL
ncbi:MAG: beta-lactamase family protein [Planctomycetes bacterium]|nr:beta-lactamase family protein [Planctomycetota bacterium]